MEQCCPQVLSTDVPEFDSFRDGLYVTSGFLNLGALIIRIGFWAPYTSLIIRNSETAFCLLHRALLWMFHVFMLSICHTAASSKQRRRLPKMGGRAFEHPKSGERSYTHQSSQSSDLGNWGPHDSRFRVQGLQSSYLYQEPHMLIPMTTPHPRRKLGP